MHEHLRTDDDLHMGYDYLVSRLLIVRGRAGPLAWYEIQIQPRKYVLLS